MLHLSQAGLFHQKAFTLRFLRSLLLESAPESMLLARVSAWKQTARNRFPAKVVRAEPNAISRRLLPAYSARHSKSPTGLGLAGDGETATLAPSGAGGGFLGPPLWHHGARSSQTGEGSDKSEFAVRGTVYCGNDTFHWRTARSLIRPRPRFTGRAIVSRPAPRQGPSPSSAPP